MNNYKKLMTLPSKKEETETKEVQLTASK